MKKDKTELPDEEVTPEEVTSFISGQGNNKGFFNASVKEAELSPEAQEKLRKAEAGETADEDTTPKSDLPMPDDFDPGNPTVNNELFHNQGLEKMLGKITLSDMDKDLYIKALLNDEAFATSVQPIKGIDITVKSRTLFEDDLVFHCLSAEKDNGAILGPETYYTRLQLFLATVQVTKIGPKNVTFTVDHTLPFEELHKQMNDHVNSVYRQMQAPKWNAIVAAVRLFEAKLKICNDNLRDENFWQAAGIG